METTTKPPTTERREVHLRDYWATIWRWRWTVGATFVIVTTLVALFTFLQPPVYRPSVKVEIQPGTRRVAPVADVSDMGNTGYSFFSEDRYYNTQFEVIKSRSVAEKVFDRLNLWSDPQFKSLKDPIGAFAASVVVEPVELTGIVVISLEGTDKEKATLWLNTLAEAYVNRNMEMALKSTDRAIKSLLQQIEPLRGKLLKSQEETYQIAEKERIFVPEDQQRIILGRLTKLQEDLTQAQIQLYELEAVMRKVDEVAKSGGSYLSIPQVANDHVVEELYKQRIDLEQEVQRLLAVYKEKHAKVVEKETELDRLNERISVECDRIIGRLKTQYALLQQKVQDTRQDIESAKSESLDLTQRASTYQLSKGSAEETRKIYDLLSSRFKEISLSSSLLNNNIRVLDKAEVPLAPVRPRKQLNLLIGVLAGLLIGVSLAFFLEYLDNTVKTTEDIEHYLKLHILSIVPKVTDESSYAVRESLQTLRTSFLFSRKNRASNVVLVTSAGPQEGKSTTLVNLAKTMATSGDRVAVLDCDLRRPTIHAHLDLDKRQGLTNYILAPEGEGWRDYLKNSKVPNLYAMTSGPLPPNPPDIFQSDRFAQLLKEIRPHFDWVFIDSPPVASLTDSVLLASLSDMVALIIRHNQTDKELVRRCLANLRNVNPNVIGAILNHVDLERSNYRDYYYVGYYYYGEGRSSKEKSKRASAEVGSSPAEPAVRDTVAR